MKKGLVLSALALVLLMLFSLAGCGSDTKTINTGDGGIKYSENAKKSVPIPPEYPLKEFPIYKEKESFIAAIQSQDKSYIVVCFSKDKLEDVVKFYEDAFKDGQALSTTKDKDGLVTLGTKGKYTYNLVVVASQEFEGYPTNFNLNLIPADPAMLETQKK